MTEDEIYKTFADAVLDAMVTPGSKGNMEKCSRIGLRAVFEAHVKDLLVNAFLAGSQFEANFGKPDHGLVGPSAYAARIISQLTGRTDG